MKQEITEAQELTKSDSKFKRLWQKKSLKSKTFSHTKSAVHPRLSLKPRFATGKGRERHARARRARLPQTAGAGLLHYDAVLKHERALYDKYERAAKTVN